MLYIYYNIYYIVTYTLYIFVCMYTYAMHTVYTYNYIHIYSYSVTIYKISGYLFIIKDIRNVPSVVRLLAFSVCVLMSVLWRHSCFAWIEYRNLARSFLLLRIVPQLRSPIGSGFNGLFLWFLVARIWADSWIWLPGLFHCLREIFKEDNVGKDLTSVQFKLNACFLCFMPAY